MVKILGKSEKNHEAHFPKLSVSTGQKSMFPNYCKQSVIDGIQIEVYNINNAIVNHFGKSILVNVTKNLRKSQACRKLFSYC